MVIFRKKSEPGIFYEKKTVGEKEILTLRGNFKDPSVVSSIWRSYLPEFRQNPPKSLVVDASQIAECDGIGIALFFELKTNASNLNIPFEITGLKPKYETLLNAFSTGDFGKGKISEVEALSRIENVGYHFEMRYEDFLRLVEYIGEIAVALLGSLRHPSRIRWMEVVKVSEHTGTNAFFIVALIGFLLGLIMSFQSAIPMQRFGAEIFVANLVALSLFRELGPLMTAIILAGRSGSSFAAELGTMKVSEELDALNTMGLNPVRFLIVPKLISAMIVSPILTIFFNFFGLIGSAIVLGSFGYPLVTFTNQVSKSVNYLDFAGGMFKSLVFGLLIAAIGCLSGLQTKEGASAVGESTTKAVVTGIISIAVTDGIFSVIFFLIGI